MSSRRRRRNRRSQFTGMLIGEIAILLVIVGVVLYLVFGNNDDANPDAASVNSVENSEANSSVGLSDEGVTQNSQESVEPSQEASVEPSEESKEPEVVSSEPTYDSNAVEMNDNPELSEIRKLDDKLQGYGQGTRVTAENRPEGAEVLQKKYGKYDAYYIGEKGNNIYLTFDCGYEYGATETILNTLKEKNVKAVFFVTGYYVQQEPELVQRMIDEGHIVGNHTWNHKSLPTIDLEKVITEATKVSDYMMEHFNYKVTYFRNPKGEFSEQTLALLQAMGYTSLYWSYAYVDYDVNNQPDPEKALEKLIKAEHGGALYLLHAESTTNAAILGDLIDDMKSKGYNVTQFVPVSDGVYY